MNKQNKKMFSLRVFKNVVANRSQTICAAPAPPFVIKNGFCLKQTFKLNEKLIFKSLRAGFS